MFNFSIHASFSQVYDKYSGRKKYGINMNIGGIPLTIPVGVFKSLGGINSNVKSSDLAYLSEQDYAQGMQFLKAEKYDSAIKKFDRITGRKMLYSEYRFMFDLANYNISYCYYLKEDVKKCKKYLKRVSSNHIGDLSLSTLKGRLYFEIGVFKKAEHYFLKAIDQDLNKDVAFQYLILLYQDELESKHNLAEIQSEYDKWKRSINTPEEDQLNDDFEMDLGNSKN